MNKDSAYWSTLMAAAQRGNTKAYNQLLKEITPLLRNFLRKRLFDRSLVEDVVQEALMAIHKVRHTYNPEQSFTAWMFAITRYKFIDMLRKQKRTTGREIASFDDPNYSLSVTMADSKTNIHAGDAKYDIEKALTALSKRQRTIVTLLKIQGHTSTEVAKQMNMTVSAVKVAAHRAYKQMRNVLEK